MRFLITFSIISLLNFAVLAQDRIQRIKIDLDKICLNSKKKDLLKEKFCQDIDLQKKQNDKPNAKIYLNIGHIDKSDTKNNDDDKIINNEFDLNKNQNPIQIKCSNEQCLEKKLNKYPSNKLIWRFQDYNNQYEKTLFRIDGFQVDDEPDLVSQTAYFGVLGVGLLGILLILPESIVQWDEEARSRGINDMAKKWWRNVSQEPVWDTDDAWINYGGHPYSGAAYYVFARETGLSPLYSFLYAVFMSTVVWEYGIEAFAEVPSIQDLIITPLAGALLGELFYYLRQQIFATENFKDSVVGNICLFLLNPGREIGRGFRKLINYIGADLELEGKFYFMPAIDRTESRSMLFFGIEVKL